LPDGRTTRLPSLPIEIDGVRPKLRHDIPLAGAATSDIARELGLDEAEIASLLAACVLGKPPTDA
jgi:crotonobetainyl-CoA:carnitine CoA-transferase CaiB-like acyl-CoA transferase